jgi:hypothetical protein
VVISRDATQTDLDNPPSGPSAGDEGVVHSPLFDTNGAQVGTLDVRFQFTFVDLATGQLAVEADFTSSLSGGKITAQGSAGPTNSFTAGVTGGTGVYQNARGQVRVAFKSNNTTVLTYHLIP